MQFNKTVNTQKLVLLALLTAIVIVLQYLAIFMRPLFPTFTITLVLVPIVIGAALIGRVAGLWLGFVFGVVVLISGDAAWFLGINTAGAIITVLLKGSLAGLAAALVYNALQGISKTTAAIAAAISCPIVNTGIFLAGSYVFFLDDITHAGLEQGFTNVTVFIFVGMIGINFFVELGINAVMAPIIVRLVQYGQKTMKRAN